MAQTGSFIPKQTKVNAAPRRQTRRIYVFTYISYVLFFGTLLVVGGMFAYGLQLQNSLENQRALLAAEREGFSQSDIERVRELEQRLLVARDLLNKHAAPSKVLAALEAGTIQPVQLSNFSLQRDVSGQYVLSVTGGALSFGSLIFQRDTLEQIPLLTEATIGGVGYAGSEQTTSTQESASTLPISFTLTAQYSSSDLAYEPLALPNTATEVPVEATITDSGDVSESDVEFSSNDDEL